MYNPCVIPQIHLNYAAAIYTTEKSALTPRVRCRYQSVLLPWVPTWNLTMVATLLVTLPS
jgi:hypothetical protein